MVNDVRAERQAEFFQQLTSMDCTLLTEEERDVLRWGKNANVQAPRNLPAKTYREATAIEVLCAYLYLTDPQGRLQQVMDHAFPAFESTESTETTETHM